MNYFSKSFGNAISLNFLKKVGPFFLITQSLDSLLSNIPLGGAISFIPFYFFFIFLLRELRINQNFNYFTPKENKLLIQKAKRVFIANFISSLFILLGFLCFIVPGFYLCKRYMYVSYIAEAEKIGPINAMRKSKELSGKRNGFGVFWKSVLIILNYFIPFAIITTYYAEESLSIIQSLGLFFVELIFSWFSIIHYNSYLFENYKQAQKYQTRELSNI